MNADKVDELLPRNVKDLTGLKFGRWTVTGYFGFRLHSGKKFRLWSCTCECGNKAVHQGNNLNSGGTKSCGCLHRELCSNRSKSHGMSGHKLYKTWAQMIQRCTNPNDTNWPRYGGRGIAVCERWKTFELFFADIGSKWKPGLSLEREDNNGNYDPTNVRFASAYEQQNNTSKNRRITYGNKTQTIAQWAREVGLQMKVLWARVNAGWPTERALFEQPRRWPSQSHENQPTGKMSLALQEGQPTANGAIPVRPLCNHAHKEPASSDIACPSPKHNDQTPVQEQQSLLW